jgi:CRISPR-associated endonuclease/helicase Cas3
LTFEEDETGAAWIVAQTRLGRPSVNLIPLEQIGEEARLCPGEERVRLDRPADVDTQLRMLRRQLRVSNHYMVKALKTSPLPPLFEKSARLKGCFPLWLKDGQTELPLERGKIIVHLDDVLGLVIRREKGK